MFVRSVSIRLKPNTAAWWCLAACLLVPALAAAAPVTITINDLGDGNPLTTVSGFDPTSLNTQTNLEAFDLHGEYLSGLNLANGTTVSVNFNFTERPFEVGALISDTLNIVFTGHAPTGGDLNSISVDMHFRSDTDPLGATPLTNAISLAETGAMQNLTSMITQVGGPEDFNISVASDVVPEPTTWGLVLIGATGLVLGRLRRRRS
jgi:hypothetical protein